MRTTPLNGMLTSLSTNYNRRNKDVRLYEMANVYLPKAMPLTELPDERMQFTLGMYGEGDFFTMKGVVEEFFDRVGMNKKPHYDPNGDHPYPAPRQKGRYRLRGRDGGIPGRASSGCGGQLQDRRPGVRCRDRHALCDPLHHL